MGDILLRFGAPDIMVTDNGLEYTNALMEALNHIMRIRHMYTIPYNPAANGTCEKRNGLLIDMLTQFTNAFQDDWDIFLPVVTWAYNTTINAETGYTPLPGNIRP